jgi:hypothetical protein
MLHVATRHDPSGEVCTIPNCVVPRLIKCTWEECAKHASNHHGVKTEPKPLIIVSEDAKPPSEPDILPLEEREIDHELSERLEGLKTDNIHEPAASPISKPPMRYSAREFFLESVQPIDSAPIDRVERSGKPVKYNNTGLDNALKSLDNGKLMKKSPSSSSGEELFGSATKYGGSKSSSRATTPSEHDNIAPIPHTDRGQRKVTNPGIPSFADYKKNIDRAFPGAIPDEERCKYTKRDCIFVDGKWWQQELHCMSRKNGSFPFCNQCHALKRQSGYQHGGY